MVVDHLKKINVQTENYRGMVISLMFTSIVVLRAQDWSGDSQQHRMLQQRLRSNGDLLRL